jgi:hypothetical protein
MKKLILVCLLILVLIGGCQPFGTVETVPKDEDARHFIDDTIKLQANYLDENDMKSVKEYKFDYSSLVLYENKTEYELVHLSFDKDEKRSNLKQVDKIKKDHPDGVKIFVINDDYYKYICLLITDEDLFESGDLFDMSYMNAEGHVFGGFGGGPLGEPIYVTSLNHGDMQKFSSVQVKVTKDGQVIFEKVIEDIIEREYR